VTRSRLLGTILALGLILLVTSAAGSSAARSKAASYFSGYGFDTCGAPSLESMDAWLDSPYRAIGIYLGGSNRACPDGNLTPAWVNSARATGWSLLPLWVGLQAPCVTQSGLKLINPSSAGSQGKSAADSAAARAAYFGLGAGDPVYFDMEGYAPTASCTQAVQSFISAWVDELHALGYAAGVYGSANSTIRDTVPLLEQGSTGAPDDIWIARWNGVEDVFGDPVVSDSYWANHQRVHQYRGGHKETWGGVTLNIDNNYVDGAVLAAAATVPPQPPIGTIASSDGLATLSWWENSFAATATPALTPSVLAADAQGFAAGSYLLQLSVTDSSSGTPVPVTQFGALVQIHVSAPPPGSGSVVAFSGDGFYWTPITRLSVPALPIGVNSAYVVQPDGSIDIYTLVPGFFGLLRDIEAPEAPASLSGRFAKKTVLTLSWPAASDNSGTVASYLVTLNGAPILTVAGTSTKASVKRFKAKKWSVYRVVAVDESGNQSLRTQAVSVVRVARPKKLPRAIPAWAWKRLKWQAAGSKGKRPSVPRPLPKWFWRWARWQLAPYRIVR
jgi:hypothetical protein